MKRKLWIILTLAALISALWCASAMAVVTTGPLGKNVSYENDGSGTIRITGTGATNDYGSSYNLSPLDGKSMTAAVVEAGVTYLGNNVFYECANLASVTIKNPNAVISSTAFRVCSNLTTIYGWEGSTAAAYASANGYTFQSLGGLTGNCGANGDNVTYSFNPATGTLTISGTGVMANYSSTNIPWSGYREGITYVNIESGVTVIGNNAFFDCTNLSNVSFPNSLIDFGSESFWNCTSLTDVFIPNGVQYIGAYNFYGCSNLQSVTIPSSVYTIYMHAFDGCTSLTSVTILRANTGFAANVFANCPASLTLHGCRTPPPRPTRRRTASPLTPWPPLAPAAPI